MFCPNCGNQIPDGSAFCSNCGAQLGAAQAPQQPVQQPQYQQQPQMAQQQWQAQQQYAQQQPKKNTKKIVKIAVICVAVVLVYNVAKALLSGWLDDGDPVDYRPNQITDVTVTPSGNTQNSGTAPGGSLLDVGGGTTTGGSPASSTPTGAQTAASYSTDALPNEADFDWFYNEWFSYEGNSVLVDIPRGATPITDPALIDGGWKVTIYRRMNTEDWRRDYLNLDISVSGTEIEADVAWSGHVENGGGWTDDVGASPDHFTGTIDADKMTASLVDWYDIRLELYDFYTYNGKQYAIAHHISPYDPAGSVSYAGLCRP